MTDLREKTSTGSSGDRLKRGEVVSGRFVVESAIGSGGMGRIYLAHQRPFNRPVALKVMHREATKTRELVERFFQEASTVSHLAHPNTVTVYDFGRTESGQLYIAMELVDGVSLGDEIKRRRKIPAEEAIPYAIQIAQSLGEAHHKGLVHRDLKPDNVMLCRPDGSDPFVKVLDFGIAKVLGKEQSWTDVGNIVGTPHYMAPEQAKGLEVDARTDLYSLACCLFQMLTGAPPFTHESPVQVLMAHQNAEIPDLPVGFHPALNEFMSRALAKSPDDRPSDAATFVAELLATIIEMRGEDSYSGYTPSPGKFSLETRKSPIPGPSNSTPRSDSQNSERSKPQRHPLPESSPRQFPASQDRDSEPNESGPASAARYESDVGTADTVERPLSDIQPTAHPDGPDADARSSNPWKWFSIVLACVMVAGAGFVVVEQGGRTSGTETKTPVPTESGRDSASATLRAESVPDGAVVFIGDVAVGKTPLTHEVDPAKSLMIRFSKPGYVDYSTTASADGKSTVRVFAPLERARLSLEVTSAFGGTELYVDERSYGAMRAGTPREVTIPFPTDELMIRLEADGYKPFVERFDPAVIDDKISVSASETDFVPEPSEAEE